MESRSTTNRGFTNPHETNNASRVRCEASATWEEREWRRFWGGESYFRTYSRRAYVRSYVEEEAI